MAIRSDVGHIMATINCWFYIVTFELFFLLDQKKSKSQDRIMLPPAACKIYFAPLRLALMILLRSCQHRPAIGFAELRFGQADARHHTRPRGRMV